MTHNAKGGQKYVRFVLYKNIKHTQKKKKKKTTRQFYNIQWFMNKVLRDDE